jgi:hypothetical protein
VPGEGRRASVDETAWRADWAPLARHLTAAVDEWLVWKAADGLGGSDLDSAAPARVWDDVERAFAAWADREGLAAVVRCDHFAAQMILVGCGGAAGRRLLQLDVIDRRFRHGRVVWSASQLLRAAIVDAGVRRLTPGAEGVARQRADRDDLEADALVRSDETGAELMHAASVSRLLSPADALTALRGRRSLRACTVVPALEAERLLPPGRAVDQWLSDVEQDHEVARLA